MFEVLSDVLLLAANKARMLSKSADQHPAEVYRIRTEGVNLPPRNLYDDLSSLQSLASLTILALGKDHAKTKQAQEVIYTLREQLAAHDTALGPKLNNALKGTTPPKPFVGRDVSGTNGKYLGKV